MRVQSCSLKTFTRHKKYDTVICVEICVGRIVAITPRCKRGAFGLRGFESLPTHKISIEMKNRAEISGLRTWIEIDRKAIKNNYNVFRKLLSKTTKLMSVVKSNAYGHGLVDFSKEIQKLGVDFFGVDSIVEADTLRESGIKKPILVLGYTLAVRFKEALRNNASLTISDFESLKNIEKYKKTLNNLKIHIKIDTGMHRQGFFPEEIPRVIQILKTLPRIKVEGLYTHFSSAKNPNSKTETSKQINQFKKVIQLFEEASFRNTIKHASATGGTLVFSGEYFDMVRVGIGLYGLWPSKEIENVYRNKIKLKPVLSWKTIVPQIKKVPKGAGVGYDLTEKLSRDSIVAILPVGYWHGFPRSLSGKGNVLIRGVKAKVLGRVSMDMIVVDVTDVKGAKVLDVVTIIGKDSAQEITARDTAYFAETSQYEIITRLNPLIKRIVV